MTYNENKKKYDIQYAKEKLKRVPLNLQKEQYERLKAAADAAGLPVNTYIKKVLEDAMEKDSNKPGYTE